MPLMRTGINADRQKPFDKFNFSEKLNLPNECNSGGWLAPLWLRQAQPPLPIS